MISATTTMPSDWDSGTGLAGYRWACQEPIGNVLLQHGFAEYAQRYASQYAHFVPRLNAAGFDVYAIDMQGHGHSPGVRRVADMHQSISQHLRARDTIGTGKPLFLFGHSLGGAVTAGSVTERPQGLAGVVLSGPALIRLPAWLSNGVDSLGRRYPTVPIKGLAPNAMTRSAEILAAVNADPLMCRGWMPLGLIGSLCTVNRQTWSQASSWQVPTLLIHGSKDKYTNPRDSARFFRHIAATDKSMQIVEGGFHETFNDPGGEVTAQSAVDWLQTRASGVSGVSSVFT